MESILISLIVSFLIALLVRMYFNEETKLKNESTKKKLSKKLNESNKLFRRPLRPKDGKIKIALLTNELPFKTKSTDRISCQFNLWTLSKPLLGLLWMAY